MQSTAAALVFVVAACGGKANADDSPQGVVETASASVEIVDGAVSVGVGP